MGRAKPLISALERWAAQGRYRWHTPGHKGQMPPGGDVLRWEWDLTEVGDFNPGQMTDPVAASERLAAQIFGVESTRYSVQGATLPVMAGILAGFPAGSRVAIERHAHRSVMAALILGDLDPVWLPPTLGPGGTLLPAMAQEWQRVAQMTDGAVVSRPTYDGIAGDLERVVATFHECGKPVVVDEAHGTHWAHRPDYPLSAIVAGADVVIHGSHKTEPTLTQTGMLHRQGERVTDSAVEFWWRILATSSPSYLLLASLDWYQANRRERDSGWAELARAAQGLWETLEKNGFWVLQSWAQRQGWLADPAKLTLLGPGIEWAERLGSRHALEKVEPNLISFILAPGQSLNPLAADLLRLIPAEQSAPFSPWPTPVAVMRPRQVLAHPKRRIPLDQALGRIAYSAVTPYPPGIPLVVPGERMGEAEIAGILVWRRSGQGMLEGLTADGQVEVVEE